MQDYSAARGRRWTTYNDLEAPGDPLKSTCWVTILRLSAPGTTLVITLNNSATDEADPAAGFRDS